MAYGIKALRKLQLGRESTAGVIQAATTLWRGEGVIEDSREEVFPVEDVGIVSPLDRSYVPLLGAKIALPATPMTFEQLPHLLEMGIKTVTPTQDATAGSTKTTGYIYVYDMPVNELAFPGSTARTIKTYTIEGGNNAEAEVAEYCFVEDLEISGKAGEAVMMSGTINGRQVAIQAFTGSIAIPDVEEVLASKGTLAIDAVDGTLGATTVSAQILSFSLKIKTGLMAVQTLGQSNAALFGFVKGVRPEVTLDVVFEHSTSAVAEKVNWRARTSRQMRLKFLGTAFADAGVTHTYKTLQIDMAGRWEKFSVLEDQDGDDTVTGTFRVAYNATAKAAAGLFCEITVVNGLSALP